MLQLLHQVPEALSPVKAFYETHTLRNTKPLSSEAGSLLRTIASLLDRMQIVIDGLDEIHEDGETQDLLDELRRLPAQILVLSRPQTVDLFKSQFPATTLSIQARNEDVVTFVYSCLKDGAYRRLSCLLEADGELIGPIADTIRERSQGMYVSTPSNSLTSRLQSTESRTGSS